MGLLQNDPSENKTIEDLNGNQSIILALSSQFKKSLLFGHFRVKRATLFRAFFKLFDLHLFWQ